MPRAAAAPFAASVGARTWVTTGYTLFSFDNEAAHPASDIVWRDTDAVVAELSGEVRVGRWLLLGTLGTADITDGATLDFDYASDDRQDRFSAMSTSARCSARGTSPSTTG